MTTESRWRAVLAVLAILGLIVGVGAVLVHILRTQGLERAADIAQLVSVVLTIAPIVLILRPADDTRRSVRTGEREDAHRALLEMVTQQWRKEIVLRQLDDPGPLAVRWRLTELPVGADLAETFGPGSLDVLRRIGTARFEGSANRADAMAKAFHTLWRRRLVLLGEPGMGKTTLAVLLLRALLDDARAGGPVPVLLTMGDWRPRQEHLQHWLVRRLAETYPALRARNYGPNAPAALVDANRILPVLDGLDELPESVRIDVIEALNSPFTREEAVILTCRTDEYVAAVSAAGPLRMAAVLEPRPLRRADAIDYLRTCLGRGAGDGAWPQVLDRLESGQDMPLTSPLDLWLVRRVYIDTRRDPTPLIDRARYGSESAIKRHLLEHLVDALFESKPPAAQVRDSLPFVPRRTWTPKDARRWLSFLARHLNEIGSRDISWWQLHLAVSRNLKLVHRLAAGVVLGVAYGVPCGALAGLVALGAGKPLPALVAGLVGGMAVGLAYGLASDHRHVPSSLNLDVDRGRLGRLAVLLAYWLTVGGISGVACGLLLQLSGAPTPAPLIQVSAGSSVGVVAALMAWVGAPSPARVAVSPTQSFRDDLRLDALRTAFSALVYAAMIGIGSATFGYWTVLIPVAAAGLLGLALAIGPPPGQASRVFLVTVALLRIRRRLPMRLMSFLGDAHRIGLLRQVGPVYQFRHATLQDGLAVCLDVTGRSDEIA